MAYRLNGHEFEQTPGGGERQGSLVYCSPQGCRDMTEVTEQQLRNLLLLLLSHFSRV